MIKYITPNGATTPHFGRSEKDHLGRAHAEIRLWLNGKQLRRRLWVYTESEAIRETERLKGNEKHAPMNWLEALTQWESEHARFDTAHLANVRLNVRRLAERLNNPPIGDTTLADFNTWLINERDERGPRAAQHAFTSAMTVAKWVRKVGLIPAAEMPFEYAQKPQHKPKERHPFTAHDLPVYAERLSPNALPLFLFLGLSGIRVSEACSFEDKTISHEYAEFIQKGGTTRRLPLDDTLKAILDLARKARAQTIAQAQKKGRGVPLPNRLFLNAKGTPWNRTTFRKYCDRVWKGLPHRLTHELRHGFGTEAGKTFSPDALKAAMGHANRETSETYVHADEQTAARVGSFVRDTFLTHLRHLLPNINTTPPASPNLVTCPHCGHKFPFSNEKSQKP